MKQLYFDGSIITHWKDCKRQLRECFWNDLHAQVLGEARKMIQGLIQSEFDEQIGAHLYERSDTRAGKRNGHYFRSLETRYGRMEGLKIPRARALDIRFSIFDKWQQVEEKVLEAMLSAYLLGRSASSAQEIIESFGHSRFSRGFLQRLTGTFEENLKIWHERPITKLWPYLFLDGMSVRIREAGYYQSWCVLWALGMDEKRNREILGFVVLKTESQEGAERLLNDLKARGLKAPQLIISDDSKALENGAAMVFPHTPQQGCTFHKVKATGKYIQNRKHKKLFLRQAADVYLKATGSKSLLNRFQAFKRYWRFKEPEALGSFVSGFDRTVTYLKFPKEHWTWIRTTNPLERFIEEMRRWTNRFGYFQGRGNLQIALFTYLCHKNPELVSGPSIQKDTIYVA